MSFNLGSFLLGLLILAAGGACVIFYQKIADNIAHGVSSYDHVKLFGIIAIVVGFLVMTGLHITILEALLKLIFP